MKAVEQTGSDVSALEAQVFELLHQGTELDVIYSRIKSESKVRQLTSFRAVEQSLINHRLVVKFALDELRLRCVAALLFLFLGFLGGYQ